MRNGMRVACFLLLITALLSGDGVYQRYAIIQAQTEQFVRARFMLPNGGVRTNLNETEYNIEYASGDDVLSESQGLLMRYAAMVEDWELFSRTLSYIDETLLIEEIVSYRYSDIYGVFPANAAIDDLRIIRSFFDATKIFGNSGYEKLADRYAENLLRTNAPDGMLCDYYNIQYGEQSDTLTLCYADFKTMRLLSEREERWRPVYESALGTVEKGYIGDEFPFFFAYYDYKRGAYAQTDVTTCQALLTAIHLAEVGQCPPRTISFVKDLVSRQALYGSYSISGTPLNDIHSTANYALASILGHTVGDPALQYGAMEQMLRFWVTEIDSPSYGGFADVETDEAYSFDNLYALIALQLMR